MSKKVYKITSPTGKIDVVEKMFKFCKENDLNPSCMFNVAQGRRKHHKGWKCEIIKDENNIIKNEESKTIKRFSWIRNWFSSIVKRINK